jgi:G3E family GTPase
VSGFLGSGKTTFVNEILRQLPEGIKTGIIQNEFAPVNVDKHAILKGNSHYELLEVNNGSVFCVCLLGDFIKSLATFIDRHSPAILIMEASGLSDTTSVSEIISNGILREKIHLAANWCIVDAVHYRRAGNMVRRVVHQIRMADVILINKIDRARAEKESLITEMKHMNPFARVFTASYCRITVDFNRIAVPAILKPEQEPSGRPGIHSMVIRSHRHFSHNSLQQFLSLWSPRAYRIKGYAAISDSRPVAVQSVMGDIETYPVPEWNGGTELIALTGDFSLNEWNSSFRQHTN